MRGLNKVTLIGNLGKDPEMQFLEGNVAVAKFSLATTETFKDKNGKPTSQTEWHSIVLWRGLAEMAQKYLHKGSYVFIEGRIKYRTWMIRKAIARRLQILWERILSSSIKKRIHQKILEMTIMK